MVARARPTVNRYGNEFSVSETAQARQNQFESTASAIAFLMRELSGMDNDDT